ncbi:MAG: crotonase/enoyl-CoA hydratase family protein [Acidobacteriota bacterium]
MRRFFKRLGGESRRSQRGEGQARTSKDNISTEVHDHVFLIGLDRAKKRNSITPDMARELGRAYGEYERSDCRCAVVFADGDDFSIGLDLKAMRPEMKRESWAPEEEGQLHPWGLTPPYRTKPMVAAVQGYCYTAGLELALACDIVIAAENARFGQLEIRRGMMPFGGATTRLVERAGWGNAMRYLLTSDAFDAQEAYRIGVIQEIVESGRQLERAIELAELISIQAPLGVRGTLEAAHRAVYEGHEAAHAALDRQRLEIVESNDIREGMMAMMQKRKPKYTGT